MTTLVRWLPLWLYALVLPTLCAAAWLLYRRDRRILGPTRGGLLGALRLVTVATLTTVLLDLASVETREEALRDEVLVVVDASSSMSLAAGDAQDGPSRFEQARRLVRDRLRGILEPEHDVTVHTLGETLGRLEGPRALDAAKPDQDGTNLVEPLLDEVVRRPRDSIAGIVLLTDGNHNSPSDARKAARALAGMGSPLIAIPIGPPAPASDMALLSIESNAIVFVGDEVDAEVILERKGGPSEPLTLSVLDGERELRSYVIEDPVPEGVSRWPVQFRIDSPGRRKITARVTPRSDEALTSNNAAHAWIDVLDDSARVLLIERTPRWEFRYLRDTWERDERIRLDHFLLSSPPDRKLPEAAPRSREKMLEYDVIVLGDIDEKTFSREQQETLVDFVRARGGTLLLLCGPKSMPYSWARSPLVDLLPVELEQPSPPREAGLRLSVDPWKLTLTRDGEESSVTRLVPGRERNVELWGYLPGPHWRAQLRRRRSGSSTLAETEDERPVFATREVGAGKIFLSAIDSTWRWRFRFGDLLYQRFWGGVVRWAKSERWGAQDEFVRIGSDRALYGIDETIRIFALIRDTEGRPIDDSRVDAVIRHGDRSRRVELRSIPESGGRYAAAIDAVFTRDLTRAAPTVDADTSQTTELEVQLEIEALPSYPQSQSRAGLKLAVARSDRGELLDLAARRDLLAELADLSGGAIVEADKSERAMDHLRKGRRRQKITITRAAIDFAAALAIVLLALLSLEWILRKRWNLA